MVRERSASLPYRGGLLVALVALAFPACEKKSLHTKSTNPPPEPTIVAMVAGEKVTMDDVREIAAKNAYDLHKPGQAELALRDAINVELLAAQAKKEGLFDDPEVRRLTKTLAVQKLLTKSVDGADAQVAVSEAEMKAYYHEHLAEFSNPTLAKGRVLQLLKSEGEADKLAAKIAEVQAGISGRMEFAEIVKRLSDLPSDQATGGATNWLQKDQPSQRYPKEVTDALFAMTAKDAPRGPIETPQGVWFVKLEERRDGGTIPYEAAARTIGQRMARTKRLATYDGYVKELEKEFPVEEYPAQLQGVIEREAKREGPPMGPVRTARQP